MLHLIVCFLLLSTTIVINASPTHNRNLATEVRRLVHQADWAGVSGVMSGSQWAFIKNLAVADSQSAGEIYFYIPFSMDPQSEDKSILTLIFTERNCTENRTTNETLSCSLVLISGNVIKLEKGTAEHTHGLKTFQDRHPDVFRLGGPKTSGRHLHLCKLDIKQINVYPGNGTIGITPADYSAGTKSPIVPV